MNKSLQAVRIGGQISVVGMKADGLNIIELMQKKPRVQGIYAGSREMFVTMNKAMTENQLRPVIDRVFPFEEAIDALNYKEKGNLFGKVCIRI